MSFPRRLAPRRRAELSPLRRACRTVLLVGTLLALVAACGPAWAARAGVGVAVAAAVVACACCWRELAATRRQHAQEMLAATRAHGSALQAERAHNASVLDAVTDRARQATAELHRQGRTVEQLSGQVVTLRGETAQLRQELTARTAMVASLRQTVQAQQAELAVLRDGAVQGAAVHVLPRRVQGEPNGAPRSEAAGPGSDVVDLQTLGAAVALPNFEGDRRLA